MIPDTWDGATGCAWGNQEAKGKLGWIITRIIKI